ncbi:MAG: peptide ABC transporter substrate-binding protein [Anaerolineae bacterium]
MKHRNLLLVAGVGSTVLACAFCAVVAWLALVVESQGASGMPLAPIRELRTDGEPDGAAAPATAADGMTPGGPQPGGSLYVPGGEPDTLDPALVRDLVSAEYVYEIFSGLVTLGPDLEVVPDLASEWDVSPDGTVYTFTLRSDALFHDGTPVTAHDVAYGIERSCDPRTGSAVAASYLGDIVGCTDKLEGQATSVAGVQVPDDRHVVITIDAPKAYFLSKLTYPTSFAVDRRQTEAGTDWWRDSNGTGPFKLSELVDGDRLVLERHPYAGAGAPWLDEVHYDLRPIAALTRYENGELDAAPVGAADAERVKDPLNPLSSEVAVGPGGLSVTYVGFNTQAEPFDDVHVRRAFNYALDRDRLTEIVLLGAVTPVESILPPGMPGHTPGISPYDFDPAAARVELAASRYGSSDALPPITLSVSGEGGGAPVAEAVADFIGESLGVAISVEQTPWMTFQSDLADGDYQAFILGWAADYPDPQDFLDVLLHSDSDLNNTRFSDPEVDRLLEAARVEPDEQRRMELYREAERIALEGAPWIPLFAPAETWVVAPYVHGFELPAIVRPRMADVWLAIDDEP